jgi:tripartite-type tricarboxylate transporter receptor subunit TctC
LEVAVIASNLFRRQFLRLAAGTAALTAVSRVALAEAWPKRPITLVVPFGAGGPTDTIGRIIAERLGRALGGTVVVANVGGAAGSIGVEKVAQAAGDGYTLGIGHWGTHAVNSLVYPLKYDVLHDLVPISLLASNPYFILSKIGLPASDLKGLIAWLKLNGRAAMVASGGTGSAGYLIGMRFTQATGARFDFVPYRGGSGDAMKDLVAGQIDLMFDQAATALPQVRAGDIRAYAVTAASRLALAPDVPTVDEAGLPGFHMAAWHGLWAPKGTPPNIIAKLHAAIVTTLADSAIRERLTGIGQEIPPRAEQTPEALAARQKTEIEKWRPILKPAAAANH